MSPSSGPVAQTTLRLAAQPASVPAARKEVEQTLQDWGRSDLAEDVGLSVTELVTNATLHGDGHEIEVRLRADRSGVRLAVIDKGSSSAAAIAAHAAVLPRRMAELEADLDSDDLESDLDDLDLDLEQQLDLGAMTGRGLFIVAALATSWGIDDIAEGTRVWAEFAGDQDLTWHPPEVSDPVPATAPASGAVAITLLGCPAELMLEHEKHLADVAREMSLASASSDGDGNELGDWAAEIGNTARVAALGWSRAIGIAHNALGQGRDHVDLELPVREPEDLVRKALAARQILERADELAEQGVLITLPCSPRLRLFRAWLHDEMVDQVSTGRPPVPFDRFARDGDVASRSTADS